jgi:hypothetical protein
MILALAPEKEKAEMQGFGWALRRPRNSTASQPQMADKRTRGLRRTEGETSGRILSDYNK